MMRSQILIQIKKLNNGVKIMGKLLGNWLSKFILIWLKIMIRIRNLLVIL